MRAVSISSHVYSRESNCVVQVVGQKNKGVLHHGRYPAYYPMVTQDHVPWQPFRRSNLNDLYALDAILHAASLTQAGRAIGLGQPAMSMKLRRLREHFKDDLIVFDGNRPRVTALGQELRPRIRRILEQADSTFRTDLEFDPATARRTIVLAAPEPIEIMLLSRVASVVAQAAPFVEIQLTPFDYSSTAHLFERGLDLVIVPGALADPSFVSLPLLELGVTGMVWDQHPGTGKTWSEQDYIGARHAALFERIERWEFGDGALDPILSRRNIAVRTALYSALPRLIIGTDLIVTTTNWLAQYHAAMLPLSLVDIPLPKSLPPIVAQWQHDRNRDPMIHWLVGRIRDVMRRTGPADNRWDQSD